jgi:hypothetical protein
MTILLLFKVTGSFEVKNTGIVIGGTNPQLDELSHTKIRSLIGESILIVDLEGNELFFDVISVQISNSIINKKNIGICIGYPENAHLLKIGSVVYSIIDNNDGSYG